MTSSQKYTPRFSRCIFMQKSPKMAYFQFPISSQSQKMGENQAIFPHFSGAGGRARTDTNSRSRDFKSLGDTPKSLIFIDFCLKNSPKSGCFYVAPKLHPKYFSAMGLEFAVPRNQCDLGDRRTRIIPNIKNYFLPFFASSSIHSRYAFSTSLKVFA